MSAILAPKVLAKRIAGSIWTHRITKGASGSGHERGSRRNAPKTDAARRGALTESWDWWRWPAGRHQAQKRAELAPATAKKRHPQQHGD
jgi:hypothetical protein